MSASLAADTSKSVPKDIVKFSSEKVFFETLSNVLSDQLTTSEVKKAVKIYEKIENWLEGDLKTPN